MREADIGDRHRRHLSGLNDLHNEIDSIFRMSEVRGPDFGPGVVHIRRNDVNPRTIWNRGVRGQMDYAVVDNAFNRYNIHDSNLVAASISSAANIDKVLDVFGTRGILAALLFIGLGCATGWLLGGPGNETRRVLALGTGQRNIAAAIVVASGSFSDPRVVVMVIVVAIVGLIVLILFSRALGKQLTIVTRRT